MDGVGESGKWFAGVHEGIHGTRPGRGAGHEYHRRGGPGPLTRRATILRGDPASDAIGRADRGHRHPSPSVNPHMTIPSSSADPDALSEALVRALGAHDAIAVDTESNSLHAWRERVCLVQFSTPVADYLVDAIALARPVVVGADVCQTPAAEDLPCGRVRRDLPWPRLWLHVRQSLRHDECRPHAGVAAGRPRGDSGHTLRRDLEQDAPESRLGEASAHARADRLRAPRHASISWRCATCRSRPSKPPGTGRSAGGIRIAWRDCPPARAVVSDPLAFWRVKGAYDLRRRRPPCFTPCMRFERPRPRARPAAVQGDGRSDPACAALAGAGHASTTFAGCRACRHPVQRYGRGLLQAIALGQPGPATAAAGHDREPDDVRDRYDRLRAWRKTEPRTAAWSRT